MSAVPAPVIAIDGPSASGKGTVASRVAQALGFHYLDSGALYRLAALNGICRGLDLADESSLARATGALDIRFDGDRVLLAGADVTEAIREEPVSVAASRVAALTRVRAALLDRQRAFRRAPGLVADGRDMGSVVFPDARLKVYLTATVEERARRRYKQLMEKGLHASLRALSHELGQRDARDAGRAVAPLLKGADAVEIDTTGMTVDAAVAQVLAQYQRVN